MENGEYKGTGAADVIKEIMDAEQISQTELAEKMGCVRQNISQALNRGTVNMRYDSFYKMIDALGYEVVVRKKQ